MPSLVAGMGSIQPSATYDPTVSPDAGQLDTIVGRKYKAGRWKRGRHGTVHGLGREADLER